MKVLCLGMMVCDTILSPVPSDIMKLDCAPIDKPVLSCGGDALNVAIGLAKLSCDVSIIGKIGKDANGGFIKRYCKDIGVDTSKVIESEEVTTACSYALIDDEGERHFLSEISVFNEFGKDDIDAEMVEGADIVYVGSVMSMKKMDKEGIADSFQKAHAHGAITIMDAAMNEKEQLDWNVELKEAFLETDIFFPSLEEAKVLTGLEDPHEIVECFRKYRMKAMGIKLGGNGCFLTDFKTERYIDCPKGLPVVDTTGAGDSFMAGLICALVHQKDVFESARFALAVATLNVGKKGGTSGIPNYEEAMRFYHNWSK